MSRASRYPHPYPQPIDRLVLLAHGPCKNSTVKLAQLADTVIVVTCRSFPFISQSTGVTPA
jgi:hypothetical protein